MEIRTPSGKLARRVTEVGDCWLDAGIVPFSTLGYMGGDRDLFLKWFPADFVVEMRRQHAALAIPIVVVTAKDVTEEDRRRLNGGVVGLIQKEGLDLESLLAQLREQVAATGANDP